jgi:hypothetical protein
MVFGHYGLVDAALEHLRIGRDQLLLWVRGVMETAGVEPSQREERFSAWLMQYDAIYRNVTRLAPDIRARERYFFGNTLRGMTAYVEGLSAEERQSIAEEISQAGPDGPQS